jgi:ABC-2 type transport system ATP-binding protein
MAILTVTNLKKIFYRKRLFKTVEFISVNDISFEIEKGEILGLLGPNGAGKTTTISMLLSTLVPTSGQIYYFGKDFFNNRSSILKNIGFATAYQKMPAGLTVKQALRVFGLLYGLSSRQTNSRIDEYLQLFGVPYLKNQKCSQLSAGEATRIMLAKAFLSDPKIVLLDEPTASLDPDIAHDIRKFVLYQREQKGVSFLFTSHDMSEVSEVCDRVLIMKKGKIIANDKPAELAKQVRSTRLNLLVSENLDTLINFLNHNGLTFEKDGNYITILILEDKVAWLLSQISRAAINFTEVSIDKPTLEDYFLSIATSNN